MKNIEFIKAGAGSGKTYTLTERLSKKIASGQVKASEVLLTTFTKTAAAEIKERARTFLLKAGLADQAKELEQASIGTVHSVALKFIKRYWYKLGIGTATVELDEDSKIEYIKKSLSECVSEEDAAWFDNFETTLGLNSRFNYDTRKIDNSPQWPDALKSVIEQMETFDVTDIDLCREKSKEMIDVLFPIKASSLSARIDIGFIEGLTTAIMGYSLKQSTGKAQNEVKLCKEILEYTKNRRIDFPLIQLVAKMLKDRPGGQKFFNETGLNIEVDEMTRYCENYKVSELMGNVMKEYIDRMLSLALRWSEEFKEYKKKNNLIDFNDMERLFIQLLEMEDVREELKEEVKLVMVDEFQDSNAKQIKIFNYLSEIAQQSIWVGDAKQAIYGFRGSDTEQTQAISYQFNSVNAKNGLSIDTLEYSWRSVPSLVEATNEIFKNTFGEVIPNSKDITLIAKKTEEVGAHSLFEWKAVNEIDPSGGQITTSMKIAWKVKSILNGQDPDFPQGYKPSDIAILCRENRKVAEVATILKSIGVPVSESGENILDYAEVQLVISILKYALNKHNDLAMAEILHLLYGVSTENLLNERISQTTANLGRENKSYEWASYTQQVQEIQSLVDRIQYLSIPDMVQAIIIELDLLNKSGRWMNCQKRMDNLMSFVNVTSAYDNMCLTKGIGASVNGLLAYINEQESIKGINTDENCVTVCSYHKAKGLEWNLVIMNELNKDIFEENKFMKRFLFGTNVVRDKIGNYIRLIPKYLPRGGKGKDQFWGNQMNDIASTALYQDYFNKTLGEENRLFYVGMTRAKENLVFVNDDNADHFLWLGTICGCNKTDPSTWDKVMDVYDKRVKKCIIDGSVVHQVDLSMGITYECRELTPKISRSGKHVSPSMAAKNDADLSLLEEPSLMAESGNRITIHGNVAEMNDIGTCIHNIFAAWNPDGDREAEIRKAQNIISGNDLSAAIPSAEEVIKAAEYIHEFLTKNYGEGKMYRELPFRLKKEGRVFSGETDLVWETGKGCILLDYKNFPGTQKQFMNKGNDEHYVGRYKPQLCLYKEALQKAGKTVLATCIYYSVIGAVVKF